MTTQNNRNGVSGVICAAFFMGIFLPGVIVAAESETKPSNLFEMSLEELMNVPVVSASRLPTGTKYLSAATTVITAEDIHYSGATTIPGAEIRPEQIYRRRSRSVRNVFRPDSGPD